MLDDGQPVEDEPRPADRAEASEDARLDVSADDEWPAGHHEAVRPRRGGGSPRAAIAAAIVAAGATLLVVGLQSVTGDSGDGAPPGDASGLSGAIGAGPALSLTDDETPAGQYERWDATDDDLIRDFRNIYPDINIGAGYSIVSESLEVCEHLRSTQSGPPLDSYLLSTDPVGHEWPQVADAIMDVATTSMCPEYREPVEAYRAYLEEPDDLT